MAWRLQSLIFHNFKFFCDDFPFETKLKNVLLYGENGSGKSSVSWGFYTFIESRLKSSPNEVMKYFQSGHLENLRNIHSASPDSSIVANFSEDTPDPAHRRTAGYEISNRVVESQRSPDVFLDYTVSSCDYFNYKMLSDLTYQRNSKELDLFDYFESELFRFLNLGHQYRDINGNFPADGGLLAKEWWNYICSVRLPMTRRSQVNRTTAEYTEFVRLLSDFRDEVNIMLRSLVASANDMLHTTLNMPEVDLNIEMSSVPFNLLKEGRRRYKDGRVHKPKILVKAYVQNRVTGRQETVTHLYSFFNEAKLTCIGLALRLAISDYKLITMGDVAPVLFIDDLLISLDMGKRLPVLDLLMSKANTRQLIVFTHDRSLFNCMKDMIIDAGKKDEWNFDLLYEKDSSITGLPYSKPELVADSKDYLEQAQMHIGRTDYPAAGNYLRKYAEQQIKAILPENFWVSFNNSGEVKANMLQKLYDNLRSSKFLALYGFVATDFPDIQPHIKMLMNPLSHDNKDVPVYKSELLSCILKLKMFQPIIDKKKVIVARGEVDRATFRISLVDSVGSTQTVEFKAIEQWDLFDYAPRKYKDCMVRVINSSIRGVSIGTSFNVNALYQSACHTVCSYAGAIVPPFQEAVTNVATGLRLMDL